MFSDKDILKIGKEAKTEFLRKHDVSCNILTCDLDEFWRIAKKSKLVQQEIRLGLPLKIGSLTIHGKKSEIVLNADIINSLTRSKDFIKALVIHELYHVYFNNKINSLGDAIDSENQDKYLFSKEFSRYYKILGRQKDF